MIKYCQKQEDQQKNSMVFNNGDSIFNGDEFISSYVYNSLENIPIFDTNGVFSKRVWTLDKLYNFTEKDYDLAIWHLPAEKETGLKELFYQIVDFESPFWNSTDSLVIFLSSFFNIPKTKKSKVKLLLIRCKDVLKRVLH